jgi:hypothetical protein
VKRITTEDDLIIEMGSANWVGGSVYSLVGAVVIVFAIALLLYWVD